MTTNPETTASVRAWVRYGCGCAEGFWISTAARCSACDAPVIAYSDVVDLAPPDEREWTPLEPAHV